MGVKAVGKGALDPATSKHRTRLAIDRKAEMASGWVNAICADELLCACDGSWEPGR